MLLRRPPRLRRGDTIAVISPAAAVQAEALQRGCDTLAQLGFAVRIGEHALDRHRFLAGADVDRAAELTALFQDPDVRAIFCSRAGYGSGRLLPLLNLHEVARHPKIFLGFSDVTFLLNAFVQHAGVVCFHGPLVAGAFAEGQSPRARDHLFGVLTTGQGESCLPFLTRCGWVLEKGGSSADAFLFLLQLLGPPLPWTRRARCCLSKMWESDPIASIVC